MTAETQPSHLTDFLGRIADALVQEPERPDIVPVPFEVLNESSLSLADLDPRACFATPYEMGDVHLEVVVIGDGHGGWSAQVEPRLVSIGEEDEMEDPERILTALALDLVARRRAEVLGDVLKSRLLLGELPGYAVQVHLTMRAGGRVATAVLDVAKRFQRMWAQARQVGLAGRAVAEREGRATYGD